MEAVSGHFGTVGVFSAFDPGVGFWYVHVRHFEVQLPCGVSRMVAIMELACPPYWRQAVCPGASGPKRDHREQLFFLCIFLLMMSRRAARWF
jgi:hypothetical protein